MIAGRIESGVHTVSTAEAEEIVGNAKEAGWHIYELPSGAASRQAFFDAVRETLPLDPPLLSSKSWDALADSLFGGFDAQRVPGIVVTWPFVATKRNSAADYAMIREIFAQLCETLAAGNATFGHSKSVVVLLVS